MDNKKENGFDDRNIILSKYKATGNFGWMHLIIAQDKLTGQKFIRIKRYLNWYSIKNKKQFVAVRDMLRKGAIELGWLTDNTTSQQTIDENVIITKELNNENNTEIIQIDGIPNELIDFMEENPNIVGKILSLPFKNRDFNYTFDILKTIDEMIIEGNSRIKVAFKEIVEKIVKEDAKAMQELSDLMEQYNLWQITSVTKLVQTRLQTIDVFEKMIQDETTYEINNDKSIHRLLEKNMWLIDEDYWIAQSNKSLRKFIGDEIVKKHKEYASKRPDFACVDFENRLILLELKRPSIELTKKELDQAELYHMIIKQYKDKDFNSIKIILLGNKISEEAGQIVKLRNGVEIKTYNDFLQKTKKRYKEFLDKIENEI